MIGNDLVDLKHISETCSWQRPRFLDKVFTIEEQKLIIGSKNEHQMVWKLWSMKEAAYKVYVQENGKRFFNPKRLECEFISENEGIVRIENNRYYTNSKSTENYIHTVATLNRNIPINSSVFKTKKTSYKVQSSVLKYEFLSFIAKTKQLDIKLLYIKKTEIGIPQLFYNSIQIPIDFSLTHCGRFSGFVC